MWGDFAGQAPRFFKINPKNFSGRRLYSLIGPDSNLLVTNSCKFMVNAAHKHGVPNVEWLTQNLNILHRHRTYDVVLVCGKVAQATYKQCNFTPRLYTRVIEIPHPAARTVWTREYIETVRILIKGQLK